MSEKGLVNQGWKDSGDAIVHAGGQPAAVVSSNPGQALWTGIADGVVYVVKNIQILPAASGKRD